MSECKPERKLIHVVAAVILNPAGEVLIAKRPDDKHQGGLWEFPGGKVEPGEAAQVALERELEEELGIKIAAATPLIKVPYHYPDKSVLLDVYTVTEFSGNPWGREGQPVEWVNKSALSEYAFPAANKPILNACILPALVAMTPDFDDSGAIVDVTKLAITKGAEAVLLRNFTLSDAEINSVYAELMELAVASGVELILHSEVAERLQVGHESVHLNAKALQALRSRDTYQGRWLGASCHSDAEIALAVEKGLDYVTLSPVLATSSHPEQKGMGWAQFSELANSHPIPVFGLGGLSQADLDDVCESGGQGVVAISAWLEE